MDVRHDESTVCDEKETPERITPIDFDIAGKAGKVEWEKRKLERENVHLRNCIYFTVAAVLSVAIVSALIGVFN